MTTTPAVATIVVSDAVTKLEALDALARLIGTDIEGARTASPRVRIAAGAWARIEIPKFGEDGPLAIDVDAEDGDTARRRALALADRLREGMGWSVHPAFPAA